MIRVGEPNVQYTPGFPTFLSGTSCNCDSAVDNLKSPADVFVVPVTVPFQHLEKWSFFSDQTFDPFDKTF